MESNYLGSNYMHVGDGGIPLGAVIVDPNESIPSWLVLLSDEDLAAFTYEPGKWLWVNGARVPVPVPTSDQTLSEAKALKVTQLKLARNAQELSGFTYMGKVFDSDQDAQRRISVAVMAAQYAPDDWTIDWTCQDNSILTLTKAQFLQMPLVMAATGNALFVKYRNLKVQVDAATTVDAVQAINW